MTRQFCEHRESGEAQCPPAFRNSYQCDDCGTSWTDVWSCGCDDECPKCGRDISPEESTEIGECACEVLRWLL